MSKKILIICGATGSGKSSLAIEVAKKLNTEIISADSLAIYKELDIGTAKPTKEEQSIVKHHLIDVVSPFETFSVSDYESLALPIIDKLLSEKSTIHDRVNLAVNKSDVEVNKEEKRIDTVVEIDTDICSVSDYFEIYHTRINMCCKAADLLGYKYGFIVNKMRML